MRLVLHIGMHKTGTSAVQEYCRINQRRLCAQGIAYPVGLFERYPGQHSELYDLAESAGEAGVAALASELRARHIGDCDTVFLSGESLCAANRKVAMAIVNGFQSCFEDIHAVFVVRNKADYLYSQFNQHMRHANYTVTFDSFVNRMKYSPRRTFDAWQTICVENGRCEFQVMNYDDIRGNLVISFLRKAVGANVALDGLNEPPQERNPAMDYLSADIVNALVKDMDFQTSADVMNCYRRAFQERRYQLPIEYVLKRELSSRYPDDWWYLPGYEHWYEDLVGLKAQGEQQVPGTEYLDDLIRFLELVRELNE